MIVLFLLLAYLIGSIPSALIISKNIKNIDIREHGSKNMGATNVFRVLGVKLGIITLLLDIIKGFFAVKLYSFLNYEFILYNDSFLFDILLGITAILGHVYPIFAKFKGGKGVASAVGISFALNPIGTIIVIAIFVLLMFIFRIVSISVLISGFFYPFVITNFFVLNSISLLVFSLCLYLFIIFTHKKNIYRILNKQEKKLF